MKPSVSIMLRWSAKALANDRVWLTHKKDLCLKANSITKSDPSIDSAYYIQFHLVFNICLYSKLLKIEPRASWESPKTAVAYSILYRIFLTVINTDFKHLGTSPPPDVPNMSDH